MKKLFDLTYPQKSILLTEQFFKNMPVNNICGTAIINEEINFDNLKKAINFVIKNNDNFRIHLFQDKREVKQYLSEVINYNAEIIEIENKTEIENIENSLKKKVFSLFDSDLFEIKIFKLKDRSGGFLLIFYYFFK